jgi:hypothetical protein
MVFSPFYHYGMYSEIMKPKPSYTAYQVYIDGEILQTKNYAPQKWDKIVQPIVYFSKHSNWNAQMFAEVNRLTGINDQKKYLDQITKQEFYAWYKHYLTSVLGKEINIVEVTMSEYTPAK